MAVIAELDIVVGTTADEVELAADEPAAEPEVDATAEPPAVILNIFDWARMALLAETRLIWNSVPVGHAPLYVTVAELTVLADPVDWFATSEYGELGRKPACEL